MIRTRVALALVILVGALVALWASASNDSAPPRARAQLEDDQLGAELDAGVPGMPSVDGATPSSSDSGPPGTTPPAREEITARGRVIDDRRVPLPGAVVRVERGGTHIASAVTDAEGAFAVCLGPKPLADSRALLHATLGSRGARVSIYLQRRAPTRFRLRPVVLRPSQALAVHVEADGQPRPGATVVLMGADEFGTFTRVAQGVTGPNGEWQAPSVFAEKVRAFAHAPGRGRGMSAGSLPADQDRLVVALPPDRTLDVYVTHATTGEPVAGAEVFARGKWGQRTPLGAGCLPDLPPQVSDASGRVRIAGLPLGPLDVVARSRSARLRSTGTGLERVVAGPDDTRVELRLHPERVLRFPIAESTAGAPADGTPLEVVCYQLAPGDGGDGITARVTDDHVVIGGFPPGFDWGHVVAPDGRWAAFRALLPDSDAALADVFFRHARDVRVRLSGKSGQPLAGEWLRLHVSPRGRGKPQRTDEEGVCTWPRLVGKRAIVLWTPTEDGFGTPIAEVDLHSPADTTRVTIDAPFDVRLAVTVDGESALPPAYAVRVPFVEPSGGSHMRDLQDAEVEEDAGTGTLLFRYLGPPGGAAPVVSVTSPGYRPITPGLERREDGTWHGVAVLEQATAVTVRVTPPQYSRWHAMLERFDATSERFAADPSDPTMRPTRGKTREVQRYEGLAPGRYRLRELVTGHTSSPFEVSAGREALEVVFDLSVLLKVTGRVFVPEGEDATFARVLVDWGRSEPGQLPKPPVAVAADGSFHYFAREGRRLALRVTHPLLQAAADAATQSVVTGGAPPEFRLERGSEIRFRVAGSDETTVAAPPRIGNAPRFRSPARVRMAPDSAGLGEADARLALGKAGSFRIAVVQPGRMSLRIEIEGHVPIDFDSVQIKEGVNDLGTLQFEVGAQVRLRLLVKKTQSPAFVQASAALVGEASYTQKAWKVEPGDPAYVLIKGLGAGQFRVSLALTTPRGRTAPEGLPTKEAPFERVVESDGKSEIVVDVPLP